MPTTNDALVNTTWLAEHLADASVVVLDASFKLPGAAPTAAQDYTERHIPGARFFDIDAIADHATALPHMLPSATQFASAAREYGISNDTMVVVYDAPGLMSAGRAWWMFRMFGHGKVAILDGGLRRWLAEGRPVTADVPTPAPGSFTARAPLASVRASAQVLATLSNRTAQVVDARSAARFMAVEKEARPGLRSGHMPGSFNVPFNLMSDPQTGLMRSPEALASAFREAGVDLGRPVIASCGSGVTACALAFGLHLLGKSDVAVYDGSWAEWGQPGSLPVEP